MDKLITKITQLSADQQQWPRLEEELKKEEKQIDRQKSHAADALKSLDPTQHSLGYLYLL